jgi:hypothetical protein
LAVKAHALRAVGQKSTALWRFATAAVPAAFQISAQATISGGNEKDLPE